MATKRVTHTFRKGDILEVKECRVVFYTRNTYIKNMILADNPEKWRRAEWKKSDGKGIQNQDLWKMFLE